MQANYSSLVQNKTSATPWKRAWIHCISSLLLQNVQQKQLKGGTIYWDSQAYSVLVGFIVARACEEDPAHLSGSKAWAQTGGDHNLPGFPSQCCMRYFLGRYHLHTHSYSFKIGNPRKNQGPTWWIMTFLLVFLTGVWTRGNLHEQGWPRCSHIIHKDPTINQNNDSRKMQLANQWIYWSYKSVGEDYLKEHGLLKSSPIIKGPTLVWLKSHKSSIHRVPFKACSRFNRSCYCLYNIREQPRVL